MPTTATTPIDGGVLQSNLNAAGFSITNLGGSAGLGTVTSVGLSTPSFLTISGANPITGTGTFALSLTNQSANTVFGNLTGSPAAPTFSAASGLVASLGLAPSATTDTTNATNITSGTLPNSVLPATVVRTDKANTFGAFAQQFQAGSNHLLLDPVDTTKIAKFDLSGITTGNTRTIAIPDGTSTPVVALTAPAHNYLTGVNSTGVLTYLQPAFSDLQGTLTPSQLPNPSSVSLGGVKSLALVSHQFLTQIGTDGTPAQAQPAFADISGTATVAQGGTGSGTASGAIAPGTFGSNTSRK